MENFLRLRELGASRELLIAKTTQVYHDLAQTTGPKIQGPDVSAINALEFDNTNARYLLSAGADSSVKLFDLETQKPMIKSKEHIKPYVQVSCPTMENIF